MLIHRHKKDFYVCVYIKMCQISKEAYEKGKIPVINDRQYFWVNRRDLEIESDYQNWAVIFKKCNSKKTKILTRINT